MPALLTRISIGPTVCSMAATPSRTASATVTSKPATATSCPLEVRLAAAASSLVRSRPFRMTEAPCSASPRASASPMPWDDPVTRARLPARLNSSNATRGFSMASELPSEHLPDICQSDAEEWIGMDIEVTHAVLKPKRQFVRRHEGTGDLAGLTDLLHRKIDPLRDRFRPRLPERRSRRIAHILGQIAGTDEEDVDPFHGEQLFDAVNRPGSLDHADHQPLLMIGRACIAHRVDDGARLIGSIDHRHHQAVGAGVQIANENRPLMRVGADDGCPAGAANGLRRHAHVLKAPGAVLAIDENGVGPKLDQTNRETRRRVMRREHCDRLALGETFAQFGPVHARSSLVKSSCRRCRPARRPNGQPRYRLMCRA